MAVIPVDHGWRYKGSGTFSPNASGDGSSSTTVSNSQISSTSKIIYSPFNTAAGLLARTMTCNIASAVSDGSFTFVVSATAAGTGPFNTEIFAYWFYDTP